MFAIQHSVFKQNSRADLYVNSTRSEIKEDQA